MNMRTHGHGQGYLDLNGLIAESVDRVDYRKGTYRADTGDFSPAGAAFMSHGQWLCDARSLRWRAGSTAGNAWPAAAPASWGREA